jgi:hypothetical protein
MRGLAATWYADRSIIAYTLKHSDEGVMNAWGEHVIRQLEGWPTGRPYRALHDLSAPGVTIFYTLYADHRILDAAVRPQYRAKVDGLLRGLAGPGRVAIVLSLSLSGRLGADKAGQDSRFDPGAPVIYKTFFNNARALEWLAEG